MNEVNEKKKAKLSNWGKLQPASSGHLESKPDAYDVTDIVCATPLSTVTYSLTSRELGSANNTII
eukprot:15346387-Ditylum_brightwellii.AAC.1